MSRLAIGLLSVFAVFGGLSCEVSAQETPESVFEGYESQYGEFETFGYFPEIDVYYAMTCQETIFDEVVFTRVIEGTHHDWYSPISCTEEISLRDIDLDGTPEIRFFTRGSGTGFVAIQENYLSWPVGMMRPIEGLVYVAFSHTLMTSFISNEPYVIITDTVAEIPEGAVCTTVHDCPLVHEGTFCIDDCLTPLPPEVLDLPDWPALVNKLYEVEGLVIDNPLIGPELEEYAESLPRRMTSGLSERRQKDFADFSQTFRF